MVRARPEERSVVNPPAFAPHPMRLSADVGGTFTDVAAFDEATGELRLGKALTTPARLVEGIETGVRKAGRHSRGELFLHGTTVAINTHPGAHRRALRALITTQGFRDIYEIGRVNRPESYNLFFKKHEPLIERALRFEVRERMDAAGKVLIPLDEEQVRAIVADAVGRRRRGDRDPVPAFLSQPRARAARQGDRRGGLSAAVRHRFARTVAGISRIRAHLDGGGQCLYRAARARLSRRDATRISTTPASPATFSSCSRPAGCSTLERGAAPLHPHAGIGPAAGVIGTKVLCDGIGLKNAIAFDMGGTTAKAGVIHHGEC